ncbi:MAG: hypothetical protein ACK4I0_02225 [Brevundimonas sp.]|uniref:hypothetical protein n=1 Tax=Brevundimonas sp. TaxID=1871086 RepID=UPI00391D4CD3
MTHYDNDPNRPVEGPAYVEQVHTETVVVRPDRESNLGWWIAGILAGGVLLAVIWILANGNGSDQDAMAAARLAEAEAMQAQAEADRAALQGQAAQIQSGAAQGVALAQADAARAQADAARAEAEARASEARAAEASARTALPPPQAATGPVVITPTAPQP